MEAATTSMLLCETARRSMRLGNLLRMVRAAKTAGVVPYPSDDCADEPELRVYPDLPRTGRRVGARIQRPSARLARCRKV